MNVQMTETDIKNETSTIGRFPDIKQAVFMTLYFWLAAIILITILTFTLPKYFIKNNVFLISVLTGITVFIILLILGGKKTKKPLKEIFPFRHFNTGIILPLILATAGSIIVFSEIDHISHLLFPMFHIKRHLEFYVGKQAFLFLVIVIPFLEELFFRGLILGGFLTRYTVNKAIIASSIIFAFFYIPNQVFSGFFIGIFYGWLFANTRSLLPGIFAHSLFNLGGWLSFNLTKIDIHGFVQRINNYNLSIVEFQPLWFDLCGLAVFATGIYLLNAILKKGGLKNGGRQMHEVQEAGGN